MCVCLYVYESVVKEGRVHVVFVPVDIQLRMHASSSRSLLCVYKSVHNFCTCISIHTHTQLSEAFHFLCVTCWSLSLSVALSLHRSSCECAVWLRIKGEALQLESESDCVLIVLQRSCCGGSQVRGATTCPNLAKNERAESVMERRIYGRAE